VLLHGNHQAIARWRRQQQLGRTWQRRPDLLEKMLLTKEQQRSLIDFIRTSVPPSVKKQE
jgi:tRNA (guanine37-N1)-methyltransferase